MDLISSREVVEFLSQGAPRAWVKRLLFALIMDHDLAPFITGARSVAEANALGEALAIRDRTESKEEAEKLIKKRFAPEIAAKLLKADSSDYVEEVADEWESPEEALPIEAGYFLYATRIDWEKGIVETELDESHGYDANFFDAKSSLLASNFSEPTFRVTLTGLCFNRQAVEMLLPSAQLSPLTQSQSEKRVRIGRPPSWDWDGAMLHLIKVAQTPDGLPSGDAAQAGIEKLIAEWFIKTTGNSPAESSIRSHADRVMKSLGLKV